jgi:hypothetical protein
MTFSSAPFRTLESLRTELAARVGGMAGVSFGHPILTSFLQGAQEALYEIGQWRHLRSHAEIAVSAGSVWYDLPDDCNVEKIGLVAHRISGTWVPLHEGIELRHRNFSAPGQPSRYDVSWNPDAVAPAWKVQIELHPQPIAATTVRIEYTRSLLPFFLDDHVASIPTGPLFLHALANAKQHFRQPDAPSYAAQLEALLTSIQAGHRRVNVIRPAGRRRVLDEDIGYLLPPTDIPGQ